LVTPFTVGITYVNLSEGPHTYTLTLAGYYDATGTVTVTGGQTSTVNETLTVITGSISFSSTPAGAEIFIDGTDQMLTTPVTISNIIPGDHSYTLKLTGYHDYSNTVTVTGGQTATIVQTLTSVYGNISFDSTPEGAEILLDNVDTGQKTPATISNVMEGTHSFRLKLEGYYDYTGTVTITGEQTAVVTATEVLITGDISFTSTPTGATILVDGVSTGLVTPSSVTNLIPGTHSYTLSLSGYYDATGSVTVLGGSSSPVDVAMTLIVGATSFNSTPSGAVIVVDGINTGKTTPYTITNMLPGDHTYTISLSGYHDVSGTVTITDSQTSTVTETLTLIVGSIGFSSTPSGARILINGADTHQVTPITITDLVPGNYTYTLSIPGYYDITDNVTIVGDQTTNIVNTLILIVGSISFSSSPEGAKIFLNGTDTGLMTPATVSDNVPGTYTYILSLQDYHDAAGSVTVIGEKTATVSETLTLTHGSISFASTPTGARISLDGVNTGLTTPDTVTNVLEGNHTYTLSMPGYYDYSESVTVTGGQTSNVSATLTLITGTISFTSNPSGAEISVDGTDTGLKTPNNITTTPGDHTYILTLADFHDYSGMVSAVAGQTIAIPTVSLLPTLGDISFTSSPSGSKILIDGAYTGLTTPNTVTNIIEGSHTYSLTYPGYYDYTGTLTVIGGETTPIEATLILIVGSIEFVSSPAGAEIFINNADAGKTTPTTIADLVPGIYDFTLKLTDYHDYSGSTSVAADVTTLVSVNLAPTLGAISFSSTPDGARIILDGTDTGLVTPNTVTNVLEGSHTYTVSLSGYYDVSNTVTVVGGQTSSVQTMLTLITGSISFNSTPTGAEISIDGIDTGLKTPASLSNIVPGSHEYKLTLVSYHDFINHVTVVGGDTATVIDTLIPTFGSIAFNSSPEGTKIVLDDNDTGFVTPYTINNIPEGSHSYTLSFIGYHDITNDVTVEGGQVSTLNETLTLIVGSISFSSTPSGAEIFVDDTDTGQKTPYTDTNLTPGNHTYKLTLTDYHDVTGIVDVIGDQTATVSPILTSLYGNIAFGSTPEGAEIFLDNADTGQKTPSTIIGVLEGDHAYRIRLEGYYDYTGTVTVTGGHTATVTATEVLITGQISFASTPAGAKISLDNTDTNLTTPATVTNVIPGSHTYVLSSPGYYDSAGSITVVDGLTANVTANLTLIVGSISFNTTPIGAKIIVDGKDTGLVTPNTVTNVLPGTHTYALSLIGYYDVSGTVDVVDSQETVVSSTLTLIVGSINFSSTPSGAEIFIDTVNQNVVTPVIVTDIIPGTHTYALSLIGYYDATGSVTVTGGQTTTVNTSLTLITGQIAFSTIPAGAKIFVDNTDTNLTTPNTVYNVVPGTHTYTLSLTGYNDVSDSITLTDAQTISVSKTLTSVYGNISFASTPSGAEIFIDNTDTGQKTPSSVSGIMEGTHSYKLSTTGYYDATGSVTVVGDQTSSVTETLVLKVGNVAFSSTPSGAEIFVDGMDTNHLTPATITNLTEGTHSYILKLSGYYDYMGSVTIVAAQTISISSTLMQMVGNVSINSIPAGAEIFIDGVDTSQVTPATITNLTLGAHTYVVKLSCYADYSGTVNILAGQTINVTTPLTLLLGNAYFASTPSGAEIFIDGTDTGLTTPATVKNLYCGNHTYTLKSVCYQDYSGTITIAGNQTINVPSTLVAQLGSAYITSTPTGAKIFIDEIDTGQITPATVSGILACTHEYRIALTDHFDYIGIVNIIPNSIVNISITPSKLEAYCQELSSVPVGSSVTIDGYKYGVYTPVKMCGFAVGTHTYKLEGTFNIGVGAKGSNSFNTVPKGAKIYIDGIYTGAITPQVVSGITVGTHTYRLEGTFTI
jgi:phage replication-related protein YjqB (UPF0714/DUF867 family)